MVKDQAAQKSRFTHAEEYDTDLSAEVWISQTQRMMDDLPPGKQDPKHLHIQSAYDRDCWCRMTTEEKEEAQDILNVSFPRGTRQIGDIPGGEAWDGPHKDTGFDPKPDDDERKVLSTEPVLCSLTSGCWCRRSRPSSS
jgi:hypothetical protein